MGDDLECLMCSLNNCISGTISERYSEAKNNVSNIRKYFEDDLSRADIDSAFTILFEKRSGILNFINVALKQDGFNDAIKESFVLLKTLLDNFQERISQHVLEIKDVCKKCVFLAKTAEEKDKAFDAMQSLLENGPWSINLEWGDVFTTMYNPFTSSACSKMSNKVLQKHLHLMGIIVRRYPNCVDDKRKSVLLKIYRDQLELQVKHASAVKYQVIVGCLNGLTEYLHVSPLTPEDPNSKRIYDCVKAVSLTHKELRSAPRESLKLIQEHGSQFVQYLYADYKVWHEFLLGWMNSTGEDYKAGVRALHVFYKQITSILKNSSVESGKNIFLYFISYFRDKLSRNTSPAIFKLCIKAFGLFAGPCQKYMKPTDVLYMFTIIIQRAEQIYLKEGDLTETSINNLPDYVESLSTIMLHLEKTTKDQLSSIKCLSVLLIENFPKMFTSYQGLAVHALTVTICNIAEMGGTALDDFLADVVYQGVIRSSSHQVAIDVELQKDGFHGKLITYKDYVPLWKSLLKASSYKESCSSQAHAISIVVKVYDEIIRTTLALISKLDLSTKPKRTHNDTAIVSENSNEDCVPILDPESGLEANVRKDFQVFINMVDLVRSILTNTDYKLFRKWIQPFCYNVISESSRKPLVSGFYKLLNSAFTLCERNSYFTGLEGADSQPREHRACYILLCSFLQELLVQLQQYKNDLQVACLETILAAPVGLVVPLIPHAGPAFEAVFRVGRSILPLALLGLTALDKWTKMLPSHIMQPLLVQVLPYLDPFLRSKGLGGESSVIDMELISINRRRKGTSGTSRTYSKKKIIERPDSELTQLQRQIISFLGQLDSATCLMLLQDPEMEDTDIVPWGVCLQESLEFSLPFRDIKLKIRLERLIPRVVELALSSSDRSTRFIACEFLHGIVTFMLGAGRETEASKPDVYSELFKKLALPLLKLGCDPDQAIQNLFNLLLLQLVHWYSSKFKLRSKETEILIQILMDGITHPTDTALRDFSAKCLREFIVWSIKQISENELEKSPVNIKAIMKQIYSFCLHPNPAKRLGAALVFNSIYTVLREQEEIVNQFWLELLYFMVTNLSLAEEVDAIPGSQKQLVAALEHIERVLKEKANLFNKENKRRRKPPEFEGITLKDALCWLLLKCGSIQTECRHQCMKIVCVLSPLLPDCKSGTEFVAWYSKANSWRSILRICEGGDGARGIANSPTLWDLRSNNPCLAQVLSWLRMLLTSLDCYVWLFSKNLMEPSQLLGSGELGQQNESRVFDACLYFMEQVSSSDVSVAIKLLTNDPNLQTESLCVTPWEADNYETTKCHVTIRFLDLIVSILQSSNPNSLPKSLLGTTLWSVISRCILRPSTLGFDLRSAEVLSGLPDNLINLLNVLKKSLPLTKISDLNSEIRKLLWESRNEVVDTLEDILQNDKVTAEHNQLLQGFHILNKSGILEPEDQCPFNSEQIIACLFSALITGPHGAQQAVMLQPKSQAYAESFLKLALEENEQVDNILEYLKNQTEVLNPAANASVFHGELFFVTFRLVILDYMLLHCEEFVSCLLREVNTDNFLWMVNMLTDLLQHLAKNRRSKANTGSNLERILVSNWSKLVGLGGCNPEGATQLLGLLINWAKSMINPVGSLVRHEDVKNWVILQLTSEQLQLHHKSRALDLLVCLTGPQEDSNEPLRKALQKFKEQHIPQMSSELRSGSLEYTGFISSFQKILQSLEDSGSRVILHCVVSMAASEREHVCEERIQKSLQTFIKRLDFKLQIKAIDVVYKIFLDEECDPDVRLNCAQRFIHPLLQGCRSSAAREFYKSCIQDLLKILSNSLDRRGGVRVEHQLVGRIGVWNLLELMFVHLENTELESKECAITKAAFPNGITTGKELISDLSNRAYNYRKEVLPGLLSESERLNELFRKSQCAAYNTLVAVISNTKTSPSDLKFYTGLLFSENSKTKEVPWEKLVDCKRSYILALDWEEIPKRRKQLVSIRSQARVHRRDMGGFVSQTVDYIPSASQYLFDSTLNEDVTLFDLSTSVVRTDPVPHPLENTVLQETSGTESTEINLESDDINQHECMATLCGVIQHMIERAISPLPPSETKAESLPPWMEQLRKCLNDSSRHRNIRIFLTKLLLNVEVKIRPYAHLWMNTILKVIDDGVLGRSPNYLLYDTVAMLVEWRSKILPDSDPTDQELVSQLLCLLISNVQHARRDVFKHNLELIRTVVELWKAKLDLPIQLLQDLIMKQDKRDPRVSEPGIQVSAILLANKLEPWKNMNKAQFLNAILRHMDSDKKEIYQSSAEVAGLVLNVLEANGNKHLEGDNKQFLSMLMEKLGSFKERYKERFIQCVFAIQEHYKLIVRPYMKYMLFHLPKVFGNFRIMCLTIVHTRLELPDEENVDGDVPNEEMYIELKSKGVFKLLIDRDPHQQALALNIINKILPQLKPSQLEEVIGDVCRFEAHQSIECRSVMYQILMWLYDNCRDYGGNLISQIKSTLLKGLRDRDTFLQDTIFRYWYNDVQQRESIITDRFLFALKDLYSPSTENIFLGCSVQFLLEATSGAPDYGQKIFSKPLSKCLFEDMKLLLSWRAQHATIVPMFADTLASQIMQTQSQSMSGESVSAGPLLRQTQASLAFQPTIMQEGASFSGTTSSMNLNSSLLFTIGSTGERRTSSYKMGPGFGAKRLEPKPEGSDKVDGTSHFLVPNLKRRFARLQDTQKYFAGQEVRRSERKKELQEERTRSRDANIASFRNYRAGDFPDIEIPYSSIIKPMQELAKRDSAVARQLFLLMFEALMNELYETKPEFSSNIQEAMSSILNQTKDFSVVLMETLMEITLHHSKYIALDPENIFAASQASGLFALGSLVLEENLISKDSITEPGPSKKSRRSEPCDEQEIWLQLAELYRSMDEWDVVHGIFHDYLDCGENVKEALKWESSENWSKARKMYEKLLTEVEDDNTLTDYYYEAFFKTLAHLSDWEELNSQIRQQVDNNNFDKLWDDWLKEKLLPQLIQSEVLVMLDKGVQGKEEEFLEKMNEWLLDKEKRSHLSNYFSEELSMISVLQNNSSQAQQHLEHALNSFLDNWSDLNPLSHKLRTKQLLDLQKTAEIQAFLAFDTVVDRSVSETRAKELVRRWNNTLPSAFDSLLRWDARSMYRKKFTKNIQITASDVEAEKILSCTQLAMVDSALKQENFFVAKKYLGQTMKKRDISGDEFKLQWNLRYVKAKWLESYLRDVPNKLLEDKLKCWDLLDTRLEENKLKKYPVLHVEALQHETAIVTGIVHQLQDEPDILTNVPSVVREKLQLRVGGNVASREEIIQHLKQRGLKSLKETIVVVAPHLHLINTKKAIAEAYLEVAKYCRAYCSDSLNESEYGKEVIKSVLRAMKYGSKDARQLFPCLLQIPGLETPQLSQVFCKESNEVPAWMFLGWINQLLACLTTPIGPVLHDIILRVAKTYPQAIIYSFNLSQENCELSGEQNNFKAFSERLKNTLYTEPLFENFLRAFSALGQPYLMLRYFLLRLKNMLNDAQPNRKYLSYMYDTAMKELFPSSRDSKFLGPAFRCIKIYDSRLTKLETKIKCGNKSVLSELNGLINELSALSKTSKPPLHLKDYSPWLSEFQADKYSMTELEIPGQYNGESIPLVQYHIKIVGFEQNVHVMTSKAKPMLIKMLGSDAKEHKYLVKFGEDLRQDQRIEQLFVLMNKILDQDPACQQRNLSITTYQVVPFSSHLGIVQWVNGTKVLYDVIHGNFVDLEEDQNDEAEKQYRNWIISASRGKQILTYKETFGEAFLKYSRNATIAAFRDKVNMVPWDIMRRALHKLSLSPESYFNLRQSFACSYAVMCIAHWILGIGDRHLSNTLLSLRDGRCIGIDFGYAFGVATQFIAVPELMPFRLTPHILNLLQPLEETGLFRETMIHSLRALRGKHDMLLATMEVFVQEPSIDWLDFALMDEDLNRDSKDQQEWYPQQKLDIAKLKFKGANPVFITTKELRAGFKLEKYLPKLLEAVKGDEKENIRARLPMENLSPENQVDCLIDQATDYSILGRTWWGWKPWL